MYRSKKGSKILGALLAISFGCSSAYADPICGPSHANGPDKNKNWYAHAESNAGQCCCGDYDGIREGSENPQYGTFVEWTLEKGHYRVRIAPPYPSPGDNEGPEWYDVPDSALVKDQDRTISTPPAFAEVWTGGWYWDNGKRTPHFRCLHPGAGL